MNEKELQKEIEIIDKQVSSVVIKDELSYALAGTMAIGLDKLIKIINDWFDEPIKAAHQAHKILTDRRSSMIKPVEARKKHLKGLISTYLVEQERIRKAEQERLNKIREEAERKEREKLEKKAEQAELKGKTEKAEELRDQAAAVYVPAQEAQGIDKTFKTDSGTITQKKDIEITITDPKEVLKAIVNGTLPLTIIEIKEPKLKEFFRVNQITEFPGCQIAETIKTVLRGAK